MAKLATARASGARAARLEGSNPSPGTKEFMNPEQSEFSIEPQKNTPETLFSSPEEAKAFEQISAETLPRKTAIEHKKNNIAEIKKDGLINREIIRENPVVYMGSGIDFEYPLLLGARNIILVDPILKESAYVQTLKERIKKITNTEPTTISETELQFILNSSEGPEPVNIKIEPAIYGSKETVAGYNIPPEDNLLRFQPPGKIGMILGFRTTGIDADNDKEAMENLANGGYILTDNAFESFFEAMTDEEKKDYLYTNSPKKSIEIMKSKWQEKGYDFIQLKSEGDSYQYTFLRKN